MAAGLPVCEKYMLLYNWDTDGQKCSVCDTNSDSKLDVWDTQHNKLILKHLIKKLIVNFSFYKFVKEKGSNDVSSSDA